MLTLCYLLGGFLQKTAITEESVSRLSDGAINKIIDLRKMGREPFFLNTAGKKIKIRARLCPSGGLYNGYGQKRPRHTQIVCVYTLTYNNCVISRLDRDLIYRVADRLYRRGVPHTVDFVNVQISKKV